MIVGDSAPVVGRVAVRGWLSEQTAPAEIDGRNPGQDLILAGLHAATLDQDAGVVGRLDALDAFLGGQLQDVRFQIKQILDGQRGARVAQRQPITALAIIVQGVG